MSFFSCRLVLSSCNLSPTEKGSSSRTLRADDSIRQIWDQPGDDDRWRQNDQGLTTPMYGRFR
jgi:hypothetical protein